MGVPVSRGVAPRSPRYVAFHDHGRDNYLLTSTSPSLLWTQAFHKGAKPTELRNFKLLTAIVSFFHLTKRSMHPEKKKKKKRKKKKRKKVKKVSGVMSFFAASNTLYPRWISPHSELM